MTRLPKRSAIIAGAALAVLIVGSAAFALRPAPIGSEPVVEPASISGQEVPTLHPAAALAEVTTLALARVGKGEGACSTDGRLCVALSEASGDDEVRRPVVQTGGFIDDAPPASDENSNEETYAIWPRLVLLADGDYLAGVETRSSTSYSGGGGSATELRLYRVSPSTTVSAEPVLTLPVQGSLMIRACFSEADVEKRGEACHDEYGFTAKLEVGEAEHGLPEISYTTDAWAYPRGASRNEDSTTRDALVPADLVRVRDKDCSFVRRFRFDTRAARYEPDLPLPDCSAFTVP